MRGGRGMAAGGKKTAAKGLVAVAVDKDKNSHHAMKWAVENLLSKGQTILLIHIIHRSTHNSGGVTHSHSHVPPENDDGIMSKNLDKQIKDMFLAFRCLCTRKDIHCMDVILNEADIVRSITEYASYAVVENLVLGAPSKGGFIRKFKMTDVATSVLRVAPDFCTVYIVSKSKITSSKNASRPAPRPSPLRAQIEERANQDTNIKADMTAKKMDTPAHPRLSSVEDDRRSISSIYGARLSDTKLVEEHSELDIDMSNSDLSFVSSGGRPSIDLMSPLYYDYLDLTPDPHHSTSTNNSFGSTRFGPLVLDQRNHRDHSFINDRLSTTSSNGMDDTEMEMRRLRLELKQTMGMYNTACQEAILAKQKAKEVNEKKEETEAVGVVEKEKEKAAKLVAELEHELAECRALKEAGGMQKLVQALNHNNKPDPRYRKYSIEDIAEATKGFDSSQKIGEGGYGPVYKCYLDHTQVAVKVLRPGTAEGESQFQKEVEVLSSIRHPNMVLLLGACPLYGCLVYEYMAKGSLDDRLFRRGNTPPIPWQVRLRIAAEIGRGLLFLHQTRPEPLVHRDLKPANILLDHNFVSKISDVGLARLVPNSVSDDVTQCRMTAAAGTFCYIDPEYQQTGMLGVKSDVYSFGIMLLQIITARPAMGLAHFVERAIEGGILLKAVDPEASDWPPEEALAFAKIAVRCAELRRKDRPDLGMVVMPELERLRAVAEKSLSKATQDVICEKAGICD